MQARRFQQPSPHTTAFTRLCFTRNLVSSKLFLTVFYSLISTIVDLHRANFQTIVSEPFVYIPGTYHILSQAMRAARSHRGRFRSTILKLVYESKESGIGPKTPETIVASRVESLLHRNRFLDAPYVVSLLA